MQTCRRIFDSSFRLPPTPTIAQVLSFFFLYSSFTVFLFHLYHHLTKFRTSKLLLRRWEEPPNPSSSSRFCQKSSLHNPIPTLYATKFNSLFHVLCPMPGTVSGKRSLNKFIYWMNEWVYQCLSNVTMESWALIILRLKANLNVVRSKSLFEGLGLNKMPPWPPHPCSQQHLLLCSTHWLL